jgi:hypothetical protein
MYPHGYLYMVPNILGVCDLNQISSSHLVSEQSLIPTFGHQTLGQNFLTLDNFTAGFWPLKFSEFLKLQALTKTWPLAI